MLLNSYFICECKKIVSDKFYTSKLIKILANDAKAHLDLQLHFFYVNYHYVKNV